MTFGGNDTDFAGLVTDCTLHANLEYLHQRFGNVGFGLFLAAVKKIAGAGAVGITQKLLANSCMKTFTDGLQNPLDGQPVAALLTPS